MITQEKIIDLLGGKYTDVDIIRERLCSELAEVERTVKHEIIECDETSFVHRDYMYYADETDRIMQEIAPMRAFLRNPHGNDYAEERRILKKQCDEYRLELLERYREYWEEEGLI